MPVKVEGQRLKTLWKTDFRSYFNDQATIVNLVASGSFRLYWMLRFIIGSMLISIWELKAGGR